MMSVRALTTMLMVARVELLRRIRNRSAVVTAFVGPLLLAVVFGVLMGGAADVEFAIGVVDADRSELSAELTAALFDQGDDGAGEPAGTSEGPSPGSSPVTFVAMDSEADARAAVDDGDLDAAIVVPAGFAGAVTSGTGAGTGATLVVLRDPAKAVSGEVARSIAVRFTSAITTRALATATVIALAGSGASAGDDDDAGSDPDPVSTLTSALVDVEPGGARLDVAAFFGVSMSVMFLFFTVSFAARSLIEERRTGIVARILATPTPVWAIVAGKVLAVSVLGLAGFVTVWLVTDLAFGSSWGAPVAVLATMAATVAAIGGVATFVCGFARTAQQADTYTAAVAFLLAMLGGNFVGPGQAPPLLERLASFTPNGQAIDAFTRVAVDQAGVDAIGRQLAVLVSIAVVFGAVGLLRTGRTVRS